MKDTTPIKNFPQLFAGLATLSIALVFSSVIAAKAISDVKMSNDVLVVTGSAKQPIRSDYIIWRLSVSSQQPTSEEAYQDLQSQVERVKSYLQEKQVPLDAMNWSAVDIYPIPEVINGRDTGQIIAYQLTQRLEIRSDNVDLYTNLAISSSELIQEGINIVSQPPEYLYTQLDQLRVEMIGKATKNALERAKAITSQTGNKVGKIRRASTGVFQITSRYSTDVSDYGIYDTSSLEKDITAVVSVTFSIE
jgi:hypothetical protein